MKLIILDRDGVINFDSDKYIKSTEEWEAIPGSMEAIAKLTQAGYKIVVCTNQSAVGRGLITIETLNSIHQKMHKAAHLAGGTIAAIVFCPHKPEDKCPDRKPSAKMITDICDRFNVDDISSLMMVGDSERDLASIHSAGGIPVLVRTGNGKKTLAKGKIPPGTLVFDNLLEVSEYLVNKQNEDEDE